MDIGPSSVSIQPVHDRQQYSASIVSQTLNSLNDSFSMGAPVDVEGPREVVAGQSLDFLDTPQATPQPPPGDYDFPTEILHAIEAGKGTLLDVSG